MKPAPFEYVAAHSFEEAASLMDQDVRVLAGGQSLVPLLNFRLARPVRLVDINPIHGVIRRRAGTLHIGATVRQAALERSAIVARHWPLLGQAVRHVGHAATRARGTVGGSVAHADPAAELPVALAALDARYVTTRRTLDTDAFFTGPLTTALAPDELLVAIEVPPMPAGARTAFAEHARTSGDFAEVAVAVVLAPGRASVAVTGPRPYRVLREDADEAAALAAQQVEHPHRRALVEALARVAIEACRA